MRRRFHIAAYWIAAGFLVLAFAAVGRVTAQDWRTASHAPVGLAPDPANTTEAIVQVYAARAVGWRGVFGVHTWFAVKPAAANAYTVYEIIGWRLRSIINSNGIAIQAFDQDAWAQTSNYARQDPRKSLALFRVLRDANLALLKSIPKEKWEYYGMHQERGQESVARIFQLIAGHDLNHLGQVTALVGRK